MTNEMNPHELLVAARNILDRGGICARQFTNGERHCARGAILRAGGATLRHVSDRREDRVPGAAAATEALARANGISLDRGWGAVGVWNNRLVHQDRADEVLAGFDRAIALTAPPPDLSQLTEPALVA